MKYKSCFFFCFALFMYGPLHNFAFGITLFTENETFQFLQCDVRLYLSSQCILVCVSDWFKKKKQTKKKPLASFCHAMKFLPKKVENKHSYTPAGKHGGGWLSHTKWLKFKLGEWNVCFKRNCLINVWQRTRHQALTINEKCQAENKSLQIRQKNKRTK